jgi:hypothetical protein
MSVKVTVRDARGGRGHVRRGEVEMIFESLGRSTLVESPHHRRAERPRHWPLLTPLQQVDGEVSGSSVHA